MKRKIYVALVAITVIVSICSIIYASYEHPAPAEDAVLSYTAEYLPLSEAIAGIDSSDLVEILNIDKPDVVNKVRGYTELSRTLHQRQYGGLVQERYCFVSDDDKPNTDKLICATGEMSFYAPKPYSESEELHSKVLDEGIVYVREFYERLSDLFAGRGIVLDGKSEDITKDKTFTAAGCSEGEDAVVIIEFINDTNLITESNLASEDGSYIYCKVFILIKASGEMPVDPVWLWYPMFDEPLKRTENN